MLITYYNILLYNKDDLEMMIIRSVSIPNCIYKNK